MIDGPLPRRYELRASHILTCTGEAPIANGAILIQDGRVAAVGPAGQLPLLPGTPVIDLAGCAIMPGLIDGHVHLMYRRGDTVVAHSRAFDDHQLLVRCAFHAAELVKSGVTTVRDCGSRGTFLQALRDGITGGLLPGPRLLVCGPPITTTAGHLWPCGGEADSAEEARALVRRFVKEGVDFIKVMATGGRMTPGTNVGAPQFSVEELRAIVTDAHRLNRKVAAHCLGTTGIAAAVEAGVDTIEHGAWLDRTGDGYAFDEQVAVQMAHQGTYLNLAAQPVRALAEKSANQPLNEAERRQLEGMQARWTWFRRGLELGIRSFFSTDSIYGQWEDSCANLTWLTIQLVERAGIDAHDALQMVTAIPAEALTIDEQVGTISPGKQADLLILNANPTKAIRALLDVRAVLQSGQLSAGALAGPAG